MNEVLQAKRYVSTYNRIPKTPFELYLEECEWRVNARPVNNMGKVLYTWRKKANLVSF